MTKNKLTNIGFPKKQGLYDSNKEHDSCGVGLIADINNEASHDIVKKGLAMDIGYIAYILPFTLGLVTKCLMMGAYGWPSNSDEV